MTSHTVVAIHGLPRLRVNPSIQLAPIREALALPLERWREFLWCRPEFRPIGEAVVRLRAGEFSRQYALRFHEWFQTELRALRSHEAVVVIAYSAGALILLRWLADIATSAEVDRLGTVFCLAGPYQFRQPTQHVRLEETTGDPPVVREESIDPRAITTKLRPWQLVALLAERDQTVLRWNASFPPTLMRSAVDQHVIAGTRHLTLCTHSAVQAYIGTRINGVCSDKDRAA